jgi:hypothetical protein
VIASPAILNSRRFFSISMKTFATFMIEAYDKDVMGSSQIRRTGEGGRVGKDRRKTDAEKRRTKLGPGGTRVAAKSYKDRKDIGQQRQASTRVQQPEKERGSAEVKQSYADKVRAERKKAAQARIAARKSGGEVKKDTTSVKDKEKAASKLLTKKTPAKPKTGEKIQRTTERQYTRDEKKKMVRAGKRLVKDIVKGRDRPASEYQP